MSKENEEMSVNSASDTQEDSFSSWLTELDEKEQPQACSIDNPDCEACGS
jgi:hypothetical protein